MFVFGRRREISGFIQALKNGEWERLDAQLKTHRLPRRQAWRVALWKAAVPVSDRSHDLELRGWAWLRTHCMRLRTASRQDVMVHVMGQAHEGVLHPLLDSFCPRPGFPLDVLLAPALRRPDDQGLTWLHARGVCLDPPAVADRPPVLQWVLTTRVLQPATVRVVKGLLARGVRVRTSGAPSPLVVLLTIAERYDLSNPAPLECAQQLWALLEGAGDDPDTPDVQAALAKVPKLAQWRIGCRMAMQRRGRAERRVLPTHVRCRA